MDEHGLVPFAFAEIIQVERLVQKNAMQIPPRTIPKVLKRLQRNVTTVVNQLAMSQVALDERCKHTLLVDEPLQKFVRAFWSLVNHLGWLPPKECLSIQSHIGIIRLGLKNNVSEQIGNMYEKDKS